MDAASAHGFHVLRERRPWATTGRIVNQAWYSYYGLSTGWLTGAPAIRRKVKIWVRR
jgi:diacylglycerol kinase (ATP)